MNELSRYELSIVRAFAGAVRSAYEQYKLDICDYLSKAFTTDIFNDFENEHTIYTQGAHCIAGKILEEVDMGGKTVKPLEEDVSLEGDIPVAYWMGYLFMYWKIMCKTTGKYFLEFDIEDIYWSYESLHTMSISAAINKIENEYKRR